jgi:predicted transcriptional regulator
MPLILKDGKLKIIINIVNFKNLKNIKIRRIFMNSNLITFLL